MIQHVTASVFPSEATPRRHFPRGRSPQDILALGILLFGLLAIVPQPANGQMTINVNFNSGSIVGIAAAGGATNDYWNQYYPDDGNGGLFADGVLTNLVATGATNSGAGMLVYGVQQAGTNTTGNALLDGWLAGGATNLTVLLTNVPFGYYDVYVYGHGIDDNQNGLYQLNGFYSDDIADTVYGPSSTSDTAEWNPSSWVEGAQYVVFRDVIIPNGLTLVLQASTNAQGVALVNGIQLVGKAVPAGDADGDGLSNAEELQRGTNPLRADTDGDGVSDGLEVRLGRNPLKGAVADVNNVVGLQLFTPQR